MAGQVENLTKDYIKKAFSYLEEVDDLDKRNIFFTQYMIEDVTWEVTGRGHRLAGTRHSVAEHNNASFARVRERITSAIQFVVRSIILDNESRTACIELYGYSVQLDGRVYSSFFFTVNGVQVSVMIMIIRGLHNGMMKVKSVSYGAIMTPILQKSCWTKVSRLLSCSMTNVGIEASILTIAAFMGR